MNMHAKVTPTTILLEKLKPGHDFPGASVNARSTGRDQGIDALAASIQAEGILQSLLVCRGPKGDLSYYVIAGNRRLAALKKLKWDGEIPVIVRDDVTPGSALAMSLAENVTQCPLHPVDRFEAFAALVAAGKTEAQIADSYFIPEKVVKQSLALGQLAPSIRQAWRAEKINADVARAFTLAKDQDHQDAVFKKLQKRGNIWAQGVREELVGRQHDTKKFLTIVGREAYEAAGGKVQVDLFAGTKAVDDDEEVEDVGGMLVSDPALLVRLAGEAIEKKCAELVAAGWKWAKDKDDLPDNATYDWGSGWKRIKTPKGNAPKEQKAVSGCAVNINFHGQWDISYGLLEPGTKDASAKVKGGVAAKAAPKGPAKISNSLGDRLEQQLTHATKDALKAQADGTGLAQLLAGIVAAQIKENRPTHTPHEIRNAFDRIRERLPAKDFNAAVAKRFDFKGYFQSAPKPLVIKAITEMGFADDAKKLNAGTKSAAWKWAIAHYGKTGWLPTEVRGPHYTGPGTAKKKAR